MGFAGQSVLHGTDLQTEPYRAHVIKKVLTITKGKGSKKVFFRSILHAEMKCTKIAELK